jgi:hypothetical protein
MVAELSFATLRAERLVAWRQTPETRLSGPDQAVDLINALGLITLYPVSPEAPDLYHAYVGDPERPTEMKWDSPSGEVYSWRWILGRREVACYTTVVKKRPTWIAWDLLPAILRLLSDPRMPDELAHLGVITPGAYRIAQALEEAERPLSTGELRAAAGFPAGKEQRAAYQKALAELDARLLLTRVFAAEPSETSQTSDSETADMDHGMGHMLFSVAYRQHLDAAERLTAEQALDQLLTRYLPSAGWAAAKPLARALALPQPNLEESLKRLEAAGQVAPLKLREIPSPAWRWVS